MNFSPKNFPWGRLGRILTLVLAFSILAMSLTMASLETAAKNNDDNNLRVNPIVFDYLNEKLKLFKLETFEKVRLNKIFIKLQKVVWRPIL